MTDLVDELLDESSLFCVASQPTGKPLPAVYSGPTLGDIETALSSSFRRKSSSAVDHHAKSPISLVQREDNKHKLWVKCHADGISDDGYKWRKYGQKSIKNHSNPRHYYKCTNPRCNAKKQVERSSEDPDVYIVAYEGLHLHHAYPSLFLHRPPKNGEAGTSSMKRLRIDPSTQQTQEHDESVSSPKTLRVEQSNWLLHWEEDGQTSSRSNSRGVLENIIYTIVD